MSIKFNKYGLEWSKDSYPTDLHVELRMIRSGGIIKHGENEYGMGLYEHYRRAMVMMWPEDDWHRWHVLAIKTFAENTITVLMGPADCVAGHTKLFNPITGEEPTIESLYNEGKSPVVMTSIGPIKADKPFCKGEDDLYEIVCDDGSKFTASRKHLVLTESGGFSFCGDLQIGERLVSYERVRLGSISEHVQPTHNEDDPSFYQKRPGFPDGYFAYSHPCDEPPHIEAAAVPKFLPLPTGAQEHKAYACEHGGDLAYKQAHSHLYQCDDRPSTSDYTRHTGFWDKELLNPGSVQTSVHGGNSFGSVERLQRWTDLQESISQSMIRFFSQLRFAFKNIKVHAKVVQEIRHVGRGKFYDLTVPVAHHYFAEGFVHHNSGKTYPSAKWLLTEYWADPDKTLGLVSSTDVRGLELRIWGQLKGLFNRAKDRFPWLPGIPLESLHCITTDDIDEDHDRARVLNRGIICIPCLQGGRYVGLGKYHGIKAPRLRQVGDELQLMGQSHLDSLPNYLGKDYRGGFLGNPLDPTDPLGAIAEPRDGWDSVPEPIQTTTWKTKMFDGTCVNFIGTDSPNYDFPQDQPVKYPYLINRKKVEAVSAFWGEDSQQYYSQCKGVMKTGLLSRRVITSQLCTDHHAHDKAIWSGNGDRKRVYAVDAAYSGTGGDRCVGGWAEFGEDIDGIQVLRVSPPKIIPVSIRIPTLPEDQIATFVRDDCRQNGIVEEDIGYDSTGRGTLGAAFARIFGARVPVPVEFGGRPSRRPVRHDLFVEEEGGKQRLKRCDEHYFDFVTELWFSSRYVIECDQMRELPIDVMKEGCAREYGVTAKNKIFVESKHDPKARERMGRSPDLYDWLVTIIEMARQRGFKIQRLGAALVEDDQSDSISKAAEEYETVLNDHMLVHS